jgi:hypothetical protein
MKTRLVTFGMRTSWLTSLFHADCWDMHNTIKNMSVQITSMPVHLTACPCCRGSEVYDASRSASNPAEAQAVRRLVRQLVDQGVPRSDIGIISFFHAQV